MKNIGCYIYYAQNKKESYKYLHSLSFFKDNQHINNTIVIGFSNNTKFIQTHLKSDYI